jgi:hypothetical protein
MGFIICSESCLAILHYRKPEAMKCLTGHPASVAYRLRKNVGCPSSLSFCTGQAMIARIDRVAVRRRCKRLDPESWQWVVGPAILGATIAYRFETTSGGATAVLPRQTSTEHDLL